MIWFTESPGLLSLIGFLVSLGLFVLLIGTKSRVVFPFLAVAIFLTILPWITDRMFETDREQLTRRVYEMARCVRRNDVAALLKYVDPEARDCWARIDTEMPRYSFRSCSVSGFKDLNLDTPEPGTARVRFVVFVNVNAPPYDYDGIAQRGVGLTFSKKPDGRWLVTHFSHFDPRAKYNPHSPSQNAYGRY